MASQDTKMKSRIDGDQYTSAASSHDTALHSDNDSDNDGACSCSDLPYDAALSIVTCLQPDLRSMVRLRLLSKYWNSVLHSPHFFETLENLSLIQRGCRSLFPSESLVMASFLSDGSMKMIAYCPGLRTWFWFPMDADLGFSRMCRVPAMASCSGLVSYIHGDNGVLVFNPFTSCRKHVGIPSEFSKKAGLRVKMVSDESTSSTNTNEVDYFIVLIQADDPIAIYSSSLCSWRSVSDMEHHRDFMGIHYMTSATFLHYISCGSDFTSGILCAYNLPSNMIFAWWVTFTCMDTFTYGEHMPFKWNGRVFLAKAVITSWNNEDPCLLKGFSVYELNCREKSISLHWMEIAQTPPIFGKDHLKKMVLMSRSPLSLATHWCA